MTNVVPFRHPEDAEVQLCFRSDVLGFEEVPVLFLEVREPGETDFKVIAHRYPGKRWNNEKGWRVEGTQPGDNRNQVKIESVPELNDDDPFVGQGFTGQVERGHLKEIVSDEITVTCGQVRAWRDNPNNRCECNGCLHIFPRAVELLALMEAWVRGDKIKRRKLGYDDFAVH